MSRLLVAGLAGLALLGAGCVGGSKFPEMTPPTVPSFPSGTVPTAPTKTSSEPEKYVGKMGCRHLALQVPGLPKLLEDKSLPAKEDVDVMCEFGEPPKGGPFVEVTFSAWKNDPSHPAYRADPGRGRQLARERFAQDEDFVDDGEADLVLGEKAKWQHAGTSCYLMVLDENAVLQIRYDVFGGTKLDPLSEECRKPLRDLAKPIYDAVQPS